MKIRSKLKAGRTFEECARERDWWKNQANMMEEYAKSKKNTPLQGCGSRPQQPSSQPPYPHAQQPPAQRNIIRI